MSYTVICPSGKVLCFYVKSVAELYATLNRGFVVSNEVFSSEFPLIEQELG
jgi:hypothetical protein